MTISRVILMGDPAEFTIRKGANPHTRNRWGFKKRVDRTKAREQWQRMVETLRRYGVKIHIIPPDPDLPGLVFPANAGVVLDPEWPIPLNQRSYLLANLSPAREAERNIYKNMVEGLEMKTDSISSQFEGEADLIPWGERWIYTFGKIEKNHWAPRWGIPPWRRSYGFRSSRYALGEIKSKINTSQVIPLELTQEAFYHGDTVLCSFGPGRRYLLAFGGGLNPESQNKIKNYPDVLWLTDRDAWVFAANSFQVHDKGNFFLFMPQGVSTELRKQLEAKGVQTVTLDVSEFFEKGGGSVKCLIGDLGAWAPESKPGSNH
jgi:N-dimethylarginine dimethylaminohydrolase